MEIFFHKANQPRYYCYSQENIYEYSLGVFVVSLAKVTKYNVHFYVHLNL